jgi:putative transcriptional regulator
MSNESTIVVKRDENGDWAQIGPDGSSQPLVGVTDWARLEAMSDEEVEAAALADPDAQPLTPERLAKMRRVPRAKTVRRALGLSQEEFALRYHIPVRTLRDWEEGSIEPDAAVQAYLAVIAREPDVVRRALEPNPTQPSN